MPMKNAYELPKDEKGYVTTHYTYNPYDDMSILSMLHVFDWGIRFIGPNNLDVEFDWAEIGEMVVKDL